MMTFRQINIKYFIIVLALHFNTDSVNAHNESYQAQSIIMKDLNDRPNIIEKFDSEELLRQLESFESYRPDSFSDATRNPFDPKRYQFNSLKDSIVK
jgi:hypothetical protein